MHPYSRPGHNPNTLHVCPGRRSGTLRRCRHLTFYRHLNHPNFELSAFPNDLPGASIQRSLCSWCTSPPNLWHFVVRYGQAGQVSHVRYPDVSTSSCPVCNPSLTNIPRLGHGVGKCLPPHFPAPTLILSFFSFLLVLFWIPFLTRVFLSLPDDGPA